jgi:hypothetical protein
MSDPNEPDVTGAAVPPYEGRRTEAEVQDPDKAHRDGANVGGATGPVADDDESATPESRPEDQP